MARFSIPKRFKKGFELVANLPDAALDAIFAVLSALHLGGEVLPKLLDKSLYGDLHCSEEDARKVILTVESLYRLRSGTELSLEEFIAEIVEAAVQDEVVQISGDQELLFNQRLSNLLSIEHLKTDAKLQELRTEDERVFCRAKVVTDIRPVFGDDVSDGAESFLILHHLKIVYHARLGEHREVIVTLDADGLEALKLAIDRAERKESALDRIFGNKEL